ncbi:MAG TPA: [FeFe] hydrogenase, group A [Bacillota bacterium]|jgi:NADH-quinone oxidoreductase subunit G
MASPSEAAGRVVIDGQSVAIGTERNLLELARTAGIEIPSFCYHSELSVHGACRLCLVEIEGMGLVASCSTAPRDGMVVYTNTERTHRLRRLYLELMLAAHHRDCTACDKNGDCKLQALAFKLGVRTPRFGGANGIGADEVEPIDLSSPSVVRNPNRCVLCGDCVRVCREVQGIGAIDFAYRGPRTTVAPAFGKDLDEVDCVNCGQCVQVCPTGALTVRSELAKVWKAIHDPEKFVVVQIAPAVRVALGEEFGLGSGEDVTGKIAAALRRVGFAKVFDTVFTADLTAVEETMEFVGRLQAAAAGKETRLPLFTSCCPGWVKYAEQYHPDLLGNLSTCRSPQQMFGSLLKKFYAKKLGVASAKIYSVSIMPCTAKKFEAKRPEFTTDGSPDVDAVLTTVEAARLIKEAGVLFENLASEAMDNPFGLVSGAGVIFGATGGVAEAVLRTAWSVVFGDGAKAPPRVDFHEVRGLKEWREAEVALGDLNLRLCVVNGLGAAAKVIAAVKSGEAKYDVIEVMACPTGCIGGGGQPPAGRSHRAERGDGLYAIDRKLPLRNPRENPFIQELYREWLEQPNSHVCHGALHTAYAPRRRILGEAIGLYAEPAAEALEVSVCVGTGCYLRGSYDVLQAFTRLIEQKDLGGRVRLKATFCLEHCDQGVSVKVDGKVITGVTPATAEKVFEEKIAPVALARS